MQLPRNLEILPGVQQDANGKLFRTGRYPSGKSVRVPYAEDPQAEKHIPVQSVEPIKVRRVLTLKRNEVKRETHVRFRWNHEQDVKVEHWPGNTVNDFVKVFTPLCTSPDCGRTWKRVETTYADFYHFWHENVKEEVK